MRIAFDVSPLSHERTGVNNYLRGSLRGLAEARADTTRSSRSRRRRCTGGGDPRCARRDRCRAASAAAPRVARSPHRVVARTPSGRRALARRVRRAPLQRLAVPAAARRRPRDDDPRHRPAPSSRVDDGPHGRDARAEVPQRRANLRRDLRQLDVHRRRLQRRLSFPARADTGRSSRDRRGVHDRRPGVGSRAAVPAHGRDARAAQEPRDARARLRAARRPRARARGRRQRRLG